MLGAKRCSFIIKRYGAESFLAVKQWTLKSEQAQIICNGKICDLEAIQFLLRSDIISIVICLMKCKEQYPIIEVLLKIIYINHAPLEV